MLFCLLVYINQAALHLFVTDKSKQEVLKIEYLLIENLIYS